VAPTAALADEGLEISTSYPAVAVEPGKTASFELDVDSNTQARVDLRAAEVPEGWTATFRGGGFIVDGVMAGPGLEPEVKVDVDVPESAGQGTFRVLIVASDGSRSDSLPLDLRVAADAGGSVSLTTDFAQLRGTTDSTFNFSLELANDTATETAFNLTVPDAPAGWDVSATPSGQAQATSATVPAGGTSTISVSADPPETVEPGSYSFTVQAAGGGQTATLPLAVEITGTVAFTLTTPDQRLSTNANAGVQKDVQLVVRNEGTGPLSGVTVSGTPPTGWKVEFEPAGGELPDIPAGQEVRLTARITPSGEAIAGDYVVTFRATGGEGSSESIDMRVTVETALSWGLIGIALIILTLVALSWVFRRYGRR